MKGGISLRTGKRNVPRSSGKGAGDQGRTYNKTGEVFSIFLEGNRPTELTPVGS